ncbi:protein NRT1/ PTR FAMILY 2.3-like [Phragmites australis]|uniref:protein NRT1/ PTR FAMILY 2.3-like n=1 Tax=Phragmites australis TaxID=29695 RepID=UPI002D777C16|nr:protein NRT1/ PTR FAMILY 2.3-like [Phragmites australis]
MEIESLPGSQLKPVDREGQDKAGRKKGGWITLPFIAGSILGLGLAINGTTSNLLVYLIKEYNVEGIDAAQITNIVRGSLNLVPVAGAVVSDSYFGCFPVILAGTAVNVLSFVLFTLSAALPSLRPPHCAAPSAACQHGTPGQLAVLYAAMCLLAIGTGGTRFNVATMGADQFGSARDQDTFFNWYFVFLYASFIVGETAIVYLQDGVSWVLGFGVCLATTVASLVMVLLGARYYRMPAAKGSPYTELARVVVAAVRKARVNVDAFGLVQYYVGDGAVADSNSDGAPSKRLRFLNRAAMITASDSSTDRSGGRRSSGWRLCTVQQVEDLKSLLVVLPLWSSGILVSVSIGVMIGMVILQALAMDRSLGPRFKIPAGSITVSSLAAFIAVTPVLERAVFPLWQRVTGALPTPLHRVGLGHVVNVAGMVAAALVERRRLSVVRAHHGADEALAWVTPMSVLWLLIPLGVVGIGEALHFPGNMAFYYQEFPKTLRSTATAMAPLLIALGFYLSTVFVDVVRLVTAWLPGNINQGRLDNVYWAVAIAATINFVYFLVCVGMYKSRN